VTEPARQRSQRALSAAVTLARANGLRVDEPVVLNDLFSLMVHLRPAPVVARVATTMGKLRSPVEDWLRRELDVTSFLSAKGAPVVAPSRELPPGPHTVDGFAISFWTYLEPDPDRTPTPADCLAMLGDLHSVLRTYPGELPALCAEDIPRGMSLLTEGALTRAELDLMRASAERLAPYLAGWDSPQPLHGDAHPGNVVATREGLVWIDFEDVCIGPVEWDLASMMDAGAVLPHHPDPDVLEKCTRLRALQVAMALAVFYDDFGDRDGWDAGLRYMLGLLA
jgi:hypothetical protein